MKLDENLMGATPAYVTCGSCAWACMNGMNTQDVTHTKRKLVPDAAVRMHGPVIPPVARVGAILNIVNTTMSIQSNGLGTVLLHGDDEFAVSRAEVAPSISVTTSQCTWLH